MLSSLFVDLPLFMEMSAVVEKLVVVVVAGAVVGMAWLLRCGCGEGGCGCSKIKIAKE